MHRNMGGSRFGLAETKYFVPRVRHDVIPRQPLLLELRNAIFSHSLTLLSSPAGYGKTTLLAMLSKTYPDLSLCWLSLDQQDNDPIRFITALISSLQQLYPVCGESALSMLTDRLTGGIDLRQVVSVLINELLETQVGQFALILDDCHKITEPSVFTTLDYLIEHRPSQLQTIIATRVDPPLSLPGMRARGELAEMRSAQLRFSNEEATAFLNGSLNLDLSNADLTLLLTRTEGWPAGLRLVASSLSRTKSQKDREAFVNYLIQSDGSIVSFLEEEVFNRQEKEIQSFLLDTAILPVLTATLCKAVTCRSDAGTELREVYRRNLFLVQISPDQNLAAPHEPILHVKGKQLAVEDQRLETRYRYHDLFADFLNRQLSQKNPNQVTDLHLRAARAESDPARVISHYLAANSWEEAADVIEYNGVEMFNRGYFDTLSRWINKLPVPVRDSRPRLLHYLSHCAIWKGNWEEARNLLESSLRGLKATEDKEGQGMVMADLAIYQSARGNMEESGNLYGQALKYPIPVHTRIQALLGRALTSGVLDNTAQMELDFYAAMAIVRDRGELIPLHLELLPFFHPDFSFLRGGLAQLEYVYQLARTKVGEKASPTRLMIEEMTTYLHLVRGQLKKAIDHGEKALALRERLGGHPYTSSDPALYLMIAHAALGNFDAVDPLFEKLFLGIDMASLPPPDLPIYLFHAGRIRWLQGRKAETKYFYEQICSHLELSPIADAKEIRICKIWMESFLDIAEGNYREAELKLCQSEVFEQGDRSSRVHGNTRLMLARLYWQRGFKQKALVEIEPVLAYSEDTGIPYVFILEGQSIVPVLQQAARNEIRQDHATYLLKILGAEETVGPFPLPETGESLTVREVEILNLVKAGLSNRQIATELVISEWTVKSHLTKIYRKLDVRSRTQAIARSRALGLR